MSATRYGAISVLSCLLLSSAVNAADTYDLVNKAWPAQWINAPGGLPPSYGVYHFRRSFQLPAKPDKFIVHVSGDNRYALYVNGSLASWGPARGDLSHWRYETVDIASLLTGGKNILAAVVWNDGEYKAVAQVSNETGFLLQADSPENAEVNTNQSWKCAKDQAYSPQPLPPDQRTGYYALAANEKLDASAYPWGWEQATFDDSSWVNSRQIGPGSPRDSRDAPNRWMLVSRSIPLEELKAERIPKMRESKGAAVPAGFPETQSPVTVAAHTSASLLLDQTYLTTGYPVLTVSGGKGASVTIRYAETLYLPRDSKPGPLEKGNRNQIEGKHFYGSFDIYLADGAAHRTYRPLFWRTWRYIKLDIETADEPLTVDDIHGVFSAYPFTRKASFKVDNAETNARYRKFSIPAGAPRGCARTKHTWIARTTNSFNMRETRAFR